MQASLSKNEEEFLETYSKICSMKHLLITILLFLSSVSLSHAGLFGPSNYEECVLENVKTAQTDRAVSAVMLMCQDKFLKIKKAEYEDCVLKNLKTAQTDRQSRLLVKLACQRKFLETEMADLLSEYGASDFINDFNQEDRNIIFEKYISKDRNYVTANTATRDAIKRRFKINK